MAPVPAYSPGATVLTDRFTRAVDYAREVHAGDTRKGTTIPYLSHLLAVAALVLEHGGSEDQTIAALLHDAAEDHGGHAQLARIRTAFGDHVAALVEACSDSLVDEAAAKEDWWSRKVGYLRRLRGEDPEAAVVSGADKLHNARAVLGDYRELGESCGPASTPTPAGPARSGTTSAWPRSSPSGSGRPAMVRRRSPTN